MRKFPFIYFFWVNYAEIWPSVKAEVKDKEGRLVTVVKSWALRRKLGLGNADGDFFTTKQNNF